MATVTLLIVDDEEKMVNTLKGYFEAVGGFEVLTALTGEDALALIEAQQPSIVLLDKRFEHSPMQGLELLEKAKARFPKTQIIIISGYTTEADKQEALSLGADQFLEKPLMLPEIKKAVQEAVAKLPST